MWKTVWKTLFQFTAIMISVILIGFVLAEVPRYFNGRTMGSRNSYETTPFLEEPYRSNQPSESELIFFAESSALSALLVFEAAENKIQVCSVAKAVLAHPDSGISRNARIVFGEKFACNSPDSPFHGNVELDLRQSCLQLVNEVSRSDETELQPYYRSGYHLVYLGDQYQGLRNLYDQVMEVEYLYCEPSI